MSNVELSLGFPRKRILGVEQVDRRWVRVRDEIESRTRQMKASGISVNEHLEFRGYNRIP